MKKAIVYAWGIMLLGALAASGQATLPAFHSGSWSNAFLPTGWTQSGVNDYASNYDGAGGNAAKFGDTGDIVQIYLASAPATVSYYIKANTLSGAYVFKIQESSNGTNWTDVTTFATNTQPVPTTTTVYTNALLSASRYVRFIYVLKVGGGVGIDGVTIAGPGVPSVSFSPNGTTNAPVSNTFNMAVSISPSGSGQKSWGMTPAYSGPASLTGGAFSFTPAAPDSGKTFTVSVVATNSVGTTTGTATIAVTAYVPPVPVIAFSPAAPYGIMATYTQKLGIGVSPAGSGISSWTLLPSNYAGTATLVGTNFTFVAAQTDGPSTYVFSVVATNVYGATTGTASISVTAYVAPPPAGAYVCTFEDGSKTGYASADVTLSNKVWNLTGILIGTSTSDLRIANSAARLKYDPTDGEETMTLQSAVMSNGIGTVSFWYGPYGAHGTNAPTLAIEISETLASGWVEVGRVEAGAVTALTYYSADVYVSQPLYVRIRAVAGVQDKSANFDNIMITPSTSPSSSPYDAFLLKYNATPGDPGTGPDEDLDGDGVTNTNEFIADTNPFLIP